MMIDLRKLFVRPFFIKWDILRIFSFALSQCLLATTVIYYLVRIQMRKHRFIPLLVMGREQA